MANLTAACTYTGYNAFNPQGYGTGSAAWYGWNSKYGSQFGYAGLRQNGSVHHAFVYRFTTPTWAGTFASITLKIKLSDELNTINRKVRASLTTTNPTESTAYTNAALPSDSGRLASWDVEVPKGTETEITLTFNASALMQSKVYYLVISPNDMISGYASNYATISTNYFSAIVTYQAAASSVSASDATIGDRLAISVSNDGLSKTLTYSFGSTSGTIGTTSSASINWDIPASLANQIPADTKGICKITCLSKSGNDEVGTTECSITLYVDASVVPVISATSKAVVNENSTVNSWGIYLQNYSKIRIQFKGTATYSNIVSWVIDAGAAKFSGDNLSSASVTVNELSDVLTASGEFSISITVTDARGRTATASLGTFTVESYSVPSATGVSVYRCQSDGTADDEEGTYLYAIATQVYSQVGNNACSMKFQYKERSASSYTSVSLSSGVGLITGGGNIDVLKNYTARIEITDSLNTSYASVVISSQAVPFNLKPSAKSGAAFGMYSQDDEVVELAPGWKLRVADVDNILVGQSQTFKELILAAMQITFPVGSIYMSVNNTNPGTLFGGTWERITGRFLLAATDGGSSGAAQAAGNTGGEAEHTLVRNELPKTEIGLSVEDVSGNTYAVGQGSSSSYAYGYGIPWTQLGDGDVYTSPLGGSQGGKAHNNMPPYLAVYVWKRIA